MGFSWLKKRKTQQVIVDQVLGDTLFEVPPPPSAESALDVISNVEAERLLRLGQPLQRKQIQGDLIIGQPDLQDPFEFDLDRGRKVVLAELPRPIFRRIPSAFNIEIVGCLFEGNVILAGLWLQGRVHISSTTFLSALSCRLSQFDGSVVFHHCRFDEKVTFTDAVFKGDAHFDSSHFNSYADFYHSTYENSASFRNAVFRAQSNFSQSVFKSPHIFEPSVDFRACICHEAAFFAGVRFQKIADFRDTQFRRQADFTGATFDFVNFTNTEFLRLDIKWEQIAGEKLLFGDVVLQGIDPRRPEIDPAEFDELFARRVQPPLHEKHRQYDVLKAIFIKQGDYVSTDGSFYEWKQVERRETSLGWNPENWIVKAFHYVNWLSCGYGVKPIRTMVFALTVILVFATAYTGLDLLAHNHANTKVFMLLVQQSSKVASDLQRNVDFSFRAFMNFGPIEDTRATLGHVLLLAERLLGWLTIFLFVTTYTRMMLR